MVQEVLVGQGLLGSHSQHLLLALLSHPCIHLHQGDQVFQAFQFHPLIQEAHRDQGVQQVQ